MRGNRAKSQWIWIFLCKYKTIYTLFVRDTNNESVDLDCVNGLEFEKKIITQSEIVWHSKSWGSIELPQLEMVEVQ